MNSEQSFSVYPFPFTRKLLAFSGGEALLEKVSITEKPLTNECEDAFTHRLLEKYRKYHGTIEIVLKNGYPDYAIVTLS